MSKYVGIDLGTTFSVISYIDDNGNPCVIQNKEGDRITPSVVLFDGNSAVVGSPAKDEIVSDSRDYIDFIKRHMAESNYKVVNSKGKSFRPEEISGMILKKLKLDAEDFLGEDIAGAVITVPAYFADPQRQATKDAAEAAGLNVLGIINEPTAAAIAFGLSKNISDKKRIMVYDFGGGTFDVSILDIDDNEISVIATNGDHELGGGDIDEKIVEYVKQEALKQNVDVDSDQDALHDLKIKAEKAKAQLSSKNTTKISLKVNSQKVTVDIDRETFEELIDPILFQTITMTEQALEEAKLTAEDIDKILLVGGSTRIPAIARILEEQFGIKPSLEVNPDEAVSIGAAYHVVDLAKNVPVSPAPPTSKSGEGNKPVPVTGGDLPPVSRNYKYHDVTSHGIGVVIYDDYGQGHNSMIMPKNTRLPAEIVQDGYQTMVENQDRLELQVTQGESEDLAGVTIIGSATLSFPPRDYVFPLRMIVSCDADGIIHVRAIDMDYNTDLGEVRVDRSKYNMSREAVQEAAMKINQLNIGQ